MKIREMAMRMDYVRISDVGCGSPGKSDGTPSPSSTPKGTPHFENFPKLVAELQKWEGMYEAYYKLFDQIDVMISENIGSSLNSSIYGKMADKLYSTWEKQVLPFKNVYYKMKELSAKVTEAYKMDVAFQEAFNEGQGQAIDPGEILQNLEIDPEAAAKARERAALLGGNTKKLTSYTDEHGTYYQVGDDKYYVLTDGNGKIVGYEVNGEVVPVQKVSTAFGNTGAEFVMNGVEYSRFLAGEGGDDVRINFQALPAGQYDPQAAADLYMAVSDTQYDVARVNEKLDSVLEYLGVMRPDLYDDFNRGNSDDFDFLLYLSQQSEAYSQVGYDLERGLAGGFWEWDGAFTNALAHDQSSYDVTGYDVPHNAAFGGNANAYASACAEANRINQNLAGCDSIDEINRTLSEHGFPTLDEMYAGLPEE